MKPWQIPLQNRTGMSQQTLFYFYQKVSNNMTIHLCRPWPVVAFREELARLYPNGVFYILKITNTTKHFQLTKDNTKRKRGDL
jgi:hypothetical protein